MHLTKQLIYALACVLLLPACNSKTSVADYDVIPVPQSVEISTDAAPFTLSSSSVIAYPEGDSVLMRQAGFLADFIKEQTGFKPKVKAGEGDISLEVSLSNPNREAYVLTVATDGVTIAGASDAGTFYGIQTFRKSLPLEKVGKVEMPAAVITDAPRFAYRGAMLDVARHFFPADTVKEFIDMLALHNINTFHWHLTDHQGWRAEIKSRPLLTEIGSKRPHTVIGKTEEFDSIPVEGFYTQEEMRDIVRYAAERNITVIPEVDLPGHFLAGLAAYPELGCTGGPYEVYCGWDHAPLDVLCAGNPAVYDFLDDVFGELTEIFPSTLFHIGGDECPKEMWKECAKCQALADSLGFKDDAKGSREAKLQNHIMDHVARFLAERGRRVIGWDEVLDSDFAENAVVMSWRGVAGGIEGARRGHDVIMTPGLPMYFNFYQSTDQEHEPLALGSYVPVEHVYAYEPIPAELTEEEKKHILGAQCNLWTEYIADFGLVTYMELPRMAALSEVQWSDPANKDLKAFAKNRLPRMLDIYTAHGWNYAPHIFDVHGEILADPTTNALKVVLSTYDDATVHYTLDGSEPTLESPVYTDTILIAEPVRVRAAAERGKGLGRPYEVGMQFSKATFKPVTVNPQPHPRYTFDGAVELTDGRLASPGFTDGLWLGFISPEVDIDIDLEKPQQISSVKFRSNINADVWLFDARKVEILVSDNGKDFVKVFSEDIPALKGNTTRVKQHEYTFDPVTARYVRLHVTTESSIPEWHAAAGRQGFFFIDEVGVD